MKTLLVATASIFLTACGGGGSTPYNFQKKQQHFDTCVDKGYGNPFCKSSAALAFGSSSDAPYHRGGNWMSEQDRFKPWRKCPPAYYKNDMGSTDPSCPPRPDLIKIPKDSPYWR